MTYVREQTSAELRAHMKQLQAMNGWHDPLADRLWEEVQKLERELQAARRTPAAESAAREWISVDERLPDSDATVLATYLNRLGKSRRIRAQYIAAKTRESNGDDGDLECEYDEDADTYYWPAGWYECIDNWPDYTHVAVCEGDVTHWMPLPTAPTTNGE